MEVKEPAAGGGLQPVFGQSLIPEALKIEGTGSLRPEQIENGYVLARKSRVIDDVVVEIPS